MMFNHLKRTLTQKTVLNKNPHFHTSHSPKYNFSTTPQQHQFPPHIQQYRNILLKLNIYSLRNEIVQMKKVVKSKIIKLKKMEIINQLCQLQQEKIKNRLSQLQNKTLLQLDSRIAYQQQTDPVSKGNYLQTKGEENNQTIKEQKQKNKQFSYPFYQKDKTTDNILKESLKKLLTPQILKIQFSQKVSNQSITEALYQDWLKKNKQLKSKLQADKQTLQAQTQQNKGENQNQSISGLHKQKKPTQQQKIQHKLRRKPFLNRLFKTNQQLIVEQKKRKYLYEYEKSDILNQISQPIPTNLKQFKKTMRQINQQKKQNLLMGGFFMRYSAQLYKEYFKDKERMLYIYCGFFYYKQLISTPYLIQFIFALTFDRKIPLQFTILKIVEQYLQCPQTFKYNLKAISKQHYLKFLRASSNYILKVFKKVDTLAENKDMQQTQQGNNNGKDWDDSQDKTNQTDDYTEDDVLIEDEQKMRKKLTSQTQKFPKSKQYIDLQLLRFSLAIFQAGIQRIVGEINSNEQFFLHRGQFEKLSLSQNEQKQLKSIHETLMLSFDVYKTVESLFVSIQINDFNDLEKLSHVLTSYHRSRKYLSQKISHVHKFMLNFDKQYEQKLQLGLGNITTQKQLQVENYILKNQARKLNFDIIDNITSMLKHDNLQITLENKRMNIFGVLQRVFQVYIENDMIDFLEDQLIYNIVRFLEKQVYLDNKIRSLFDARVNFDNMLIEKEIEMRKRISGQGEENVQKSEQKTNVRKQSMMQTYGLNVSDQYDFSNTEFTQQSPFTSTSSSKLSSSSIGNEFQWFQLQSSYASQQQTRKQYDFDSLVFQKTQKSQYFMGKISELLSKQLLYSLIRIIKYKHDRKQIMIEQINGFNLIQQWYSQPTVVRLQFLKEEIIERYKRVSQLHQIRVKLYKDGNNSRFSQM